MTLHFNIGEAKAKLSQLIAAARRGEDVVIDHDGTPQVRLVLVEQADRAERERMIAKRRAFIGSFAEAMKGIDTSPEAIRAMREYTPERRKLYGTDE